MPCFYCGSPTTDSYSCGVGDVYRCCWVCAERGCPVCAARSLLLRLLCSTRGGADHVVDPPLVSSYPRRRRCPLGGGVVVDCRPRPVHEWQWACDPPVPPPGRTAGIWATLIFLLWLYLAAQRDQKELDKKIAAGGRAAGQWYVPARRLDAFAAWLRQHPEWQTKLTSMEVLRMWMGEVQDPEAFARQVAVDCAATVIDPSPYPYFGSCSRAELHLLLKFGLYFASATETDFESLLKIIMPTMQHRELADWMVAERRRIGLWATRGFIAGTITSRALSPLDPTVGCLFMVANTVNFVNHAGRAMGGVERAMVRAFPDTWHQLRREIVQGRWPRRIFRR